MHMIGYSYVHVHVPVCTPQYRVLAQYSTISSTPMECLLTTVTVPKTWCNSHCIEGEGSCACSPLTYMYVHVLMSQYKIFYAAPGHCNGSHWLVCSCIHSTYVLYVYMCIYMYTCTVGCTCVYVCVCAIVIISLCSLWCRVRMTSECTGGGSLIRRWLTMVGTCI